MCEYFLSLAATFDDDVAVYWDSILQKAGWMLRSHALKFSADMFRPIKYVMASETVGMKVIKIMAFAFPKRVQTANLNAIMGNALS